MHSNEPKLITRELSVYYGAHRALQDIWIQIPRNQITVIMGPSGCGKTTLLKCFNRMVELIEGARVQGQVLLDGIDIYKNAIHPIELRRKVGMVFQKPNPLPMSIQDNVTYGPKLHGITRKSILDKIVERCLKAAELWDEVHHRLKDPASALSVGQQQRLCIARALANDAEVLLLDEPTSALDPISSSKIELLIRRLKQRCTIVLVTHNVHQAMRLADYVIFLYLGKLIEQGESSQIFESPRNEITQRFITGKLSG